MPEGDLPGVFTALQNHPILLLVGDADPEISAAQAGSLLSGNRHAASHVRAFTGAGHGVFSSESRDEYRDVIADFLNRARR